MYIIYILINKLVYTLVKEPLIETWICLSMFLIFLFDRVSVVQLFLFIYYKLWVLLLCLEILSTQSLIKKNKEKLLEKAFCQIINSKETWSDKKTKVVGHRWNKKRLSSWAIELRKLCNKLKSRATLEDFSNCWKLMIGPRKRSYENRKFQPTIQHSFFFRELLQLQPPPFVMLTTWSP